MVVWLPELDELARQTDFLRQYAPQLSASLAAGRQTDWPAWQPRFDQHASLAAFAREYDVGDAAGRYWLRADPVVMHPDISRVHLLAIEQHGLSGSQARQLLTDLQPLFSSEGLQLSAGDSQQSAPEWTVANALCRTENAHERWYVSSGQSLPGAFPPPEMALGNRLEEVLRPSAWSAESAVWHRLQAETQMQLHQHPVNAERQADGLPALNSLWFWGAGCLPASPPRQLPDSVLAMRPELAGWSRWLNITAQCFTQASALSGHCRTLLAETTCPAQLLIEYRIQRQHSLAHNLSELEGLLGLLFAHRPVLRITLTTLAGQALEVIRPGRLRGWLKSTQGIQQRAVSKLTGWLK